MAALDINLARSAGLWNAAEIAEKRKDARPVREYKVALPNELKHEQRVALVREFRRILPVDLGWRWISRFMRRNAVAINAIILRIF